MTKDHAARMRFHRLRKDMEGADFQPRQRKPGSESTALRKRKARTGKGVQDDASDDEESPLQHWRIAGCGLELEEKDKLAAVEFDQKFLSGDASVKKDAERRDIKLEDSSDRDFKKIPLAMDTGIEGAMIEKIDSGAI